MRRRCKGRGAFEEACENGCSSGSRTERQSFRFSGERMRGREKERERERQQESREEEEKGRRVRVPSSQEREASVRVEMIARKMISGRKRANVV